MKKLLIKKEMITIKTKEIRSELISSEGLKVLSSREVAEMMELINSPQFNVDKNNINKPKLIYIISDDKGILKVGVTNNYKRRLSTLKGMSGRTLIREFTTPYCSNAYEIEKEIHNVYFNNRLNGEWFKCDFDDVVNTAISIFLKKSKRDVKIKCDMDLFDIIEQKFKREVI